MADSLVVNSCWLVNNASLRFLLKRCVAVGLWVPPLIHRNVGQRTERFEGPDLTWTQRREKNTIT